MAGAGYLAVLATLMIFEERLIFPAPRPIPQQRLVARFPFEDVTFASRDGTSLHGWYIDHAAPRAHVLYCHGNGVDVGDLSEFLSELSEELELAVFAFDYRGYGRSGGRAQERGVLEDSDAAQRWLAGRAGIRPEDVVLIGRSLGGAVAIDLAARNGARGLVVENSFTSIPDVAARTYWWLPVRWCIRTKFDSLSKIPKYKAALLIAHGTDDRLVPIEQARQLLEAAGAEPKTLFEIPGAGHNDPHPRAYYQELSRFLDGLPAVP